MCYLQFVDVVGEEFKKAINETQMQEDEKGLTFKSLIKMQKEVCNYIANIEQISVAEMLWWCWIQ